jgi:hypothetical protein
MPRDFYPRPEAAIVAFTANLSAKLSAALLDYGISPEAAAEYASLQQAFAEAYQTCQGPTTNASSAYAGKTTARIALERMTRFLAKVISGQPTVTDAMRVSLGLKPRPVRRQHRPVPDEAPILRVKGTIGRLVQLQLVDATPNRPRRPRDVSGAMILGYAGPQLPADDAAWRIMGSTTRATGQVTFAPDLPPGTTVWLKAYWFNARHEPGPACSPIHTHLSFDLTPQPTSVRAAA